MSQEEASVRIKLIRATINCIEKYGIQDITTRIIASEAGVNVASVNYYFGSKETLLETAQNFAIDNFFTDLSTLLKNEELSGLMILEAFFTYLFQGGIRYPGITKSYLYHAITANNYQLPFIRRFNVFLGDLAEKMAPALPHLQKSELILSLSQMVSALMFPVLLPNFLADFSGMNFQDPDIRRKYLTHLLRHFLGAAWKDDAEDKMTRMLQQLLESE